MGFYYNNLGYDYRATRYSTAYFYYIIFGVLAVFYKCRLFFGVIFLNRPPLLTYHYNNYFGTINFSAFLCKHFSKYRQV